MAEIILAVLLILAGIICGFGSLLFAWASALEHSATGASSLTGAGVFAALAAAELGSGISILVF